MRMRVFFCLETNLERNRFCLQAELMNNCFTFREVSERIELRMYLLYDHFN